MTVNTCRNVWTLLFSLCLLPLLSASLLATDVVAQTDVVVDDFEDGDTGDWIFFGGNAAGGGGGPLSDRPQEGNWYFSTGWGGEGSDSVFYGGTFKNLENSAQVEPPANPVFNIWVLNQSNATVDAYNLEITLREDLDGNGWTDGAEDSVQTVVSFTSSQFDDQWTLVSVPLSAFNSLSTGGDDSFNGNLDEIVLVIAGVEGGSGSVVEVDFDRIFFSGDSSGTTLVFDDMEHGNPGGNGWFSFNGAVGGGGIDPNNTDLPPSNGGAFSLQTGWGSGGAPGFFGGFGRTNPVDLGDTAYFNFWINPDPGQDYTLEINLQDDDNGDNDIANPNEGADDEFQYNCVVSAAGPCAISGGGWQLVSIPLTDFFDDNSFLTGGNGVLDPFSAGNGQLINVVIAVIGNSGSDASFRTDYWTFSDSAPGAPPLVIDDFENGLPNGFDVNGQPIGFYLFSDGSPIAFSTTDAPPAPERPGASAGNNVLALTGTVGGFAGFIHGFENEAIDTWVTQDWSGSEGMRVWVFGQNSGTDLFIDVLDNRNPGSTGDDAERFTVTFVDDFSGWKQLELPFSSFTRKEIGNGAPNDGFTLTSVHGWALGTLATPGELTLYIDQAELYGVAEIPPLSVSFSPNGYGFEEGTTGEVTVALNRAMNSDDPAQVSVNYATGGGLAVPGRDYLPTSGTLTFVNGGPREQSFTVETLDNSKWEGGRSFGMSLSGAVDVELGFSPEATAFVIDNDEYDPLVLDEFEQFPYLWDGTSVQLSSLTLLAGDALARPGQDPVEGVLQVQGPTPIELEVLKPWCDRSDGNKKSGKDPKGQIGKLKKNIDVAILTTDTFDALSVDHTTVTLGGAIPRKIDDESGLPQRKEKDVDKDGDLDLVFSFRTEETGLDCDSVILPLNGTTFDGESVTAGGSDAAVTQDFALGRNWSTGEALAFWYYGNGSGAEVTVTLKDNRAPDPGPGGWELVWAEEFDGAAGSPPDPDIWTFEIGDGSLNGIPGWGNEERQYYTDDPANAAMDGAGNLLLTVRDAEGGLNCYYGPCEYTSARLISQRKAEFAYGRIESRILVPDGGPGLWPAFWSLGTDIPLVGWPQTGEIDFMEYVSRLPNEIFGTIHGPGYNGGGSYGNVYDFGEPVSNSYHTFTVEWEPNLIVWYVDGIEYHRATPSDVPGPWVFNDPVFLLLNVAIGGNFGGSIDPNLQLPQSMAVDYIRVYQGPDSAERFEASFVDDQPGWRQVEIPFGEFSRSAEQPAGAPDDGLTLSEVWGYGFAFPSGGSALIDQVRVAVPPPPVAITVTSNADSGAGSLREALGIIASGGTISFDPALAGATIALTSGPLVPPVDVVIDASAAPGLALDGGGGDRILIVDSGIDISVNDVVFRNGYGFQLAGGILNNGNLSLLRCVVSGNTMTTDAGDFWQGGAGIYSGNGSSLSLVESTVNDNFSGHAGGGVYAFFNSTTVIERSTISGNTAVDVGGAVRVLGNLIIDNSTISGNSTQNGDLGGAVFITDGVALISNSTVADNTAPPGATGGLWVGTFTEASASLEVGNSVVAANGDFGCFLAPFGPGAVSLSSLGGSVFTDATCNPVTGDEVVGTALLGPLADNGGPTLTHALLSGSPAIDNADNSQCPAIDQRGVARPQGAGCDSGAVEQQ